MIITHYPAIEGSVEDHRNPQLNLISTEDGDKSAEQPSARRFSIGWYYDKALSVYKQHGISREANRALRDAIEYYDHVPSILLSDTKPSHAEIVEPGEDSNFSPTCQRSEIASSLLQLKNEAITYVKLRGADWQQTSGALSWLQGVYQARVASRSGPVFQVWKQNMEIAEEELFSRKFKKAKNRFRFAYKQALRLDEETMLSTISYWCLAILAGGTTKEDEWIFLKGVELSESIDGPTQILFADHLYLLGSFYAARKEWDNAKKTLERSLSVATTCNEDDALVLSILDKQSFVYDILGERESAIEARQQRRIVRQRLAGNQS